MYRNIPLGFSDTLVEATPSPGQPAFTGLVNVPAAFLTNTSQDRLLPASSQGITASAIQGGTTMQVSYFMTYKVCG